MKKRIAVLGTCVGGDLVACFGNEHLDLVANFVSVNPVAIYNNYLIKARLANVFDDMVSSGMISNRNCAELGGNILSLIEVADADLILCDLLDLRIEMTEILLTNGEKLYLTQGNYTKEAIQVISKRFGNALSCDVESIKIVHCAEWTDEILEQFINKYIGLLRKNYGKKLLLLKPRLVNQYIAGNEIKFTKSFHISGPTNKFCDRLYEFVKDYYIEPPANLIGDVSFISEFEYHYCRPYYEYLLNIIELIIAGTFDNDKAKALLRSCSYRIYQLYNKIFCNGILDRIETMGKSDCDVVVFARDKMFSEMYLNKFGREVLKWIYYDEDTSVLDLEDDIAELKKSGNIMFCVPEIFYGKGYEDNILLVLNKLGIVVDRQLLTYIHPRITLMNYRGWYEDIFDNKVYIGAQIPMFHLHGNGSRCMVGNGTIKCHITIFSCATLNIGENCSRSDGCLLVVSPGGDLEMGACVDFGPGGNIVCGRYSKVSIGDDCMFSDQVLIRSSDGHGIYEIMPDGRPGERLNKLYGVETYIGNHVWGGFRTMFLPGARVGDGSIVGAGCIANKCYPNNCIIAGVPGKVVKTNRAWVRNDELTNLEDDVFVLNNFANITIYDNK